MAALVREQFHRCCGDGSGWERESPVAPGASDGVVLREDGIAEITIHVPVSAVPAVLGAAKARPRT